MIGTDADIILQHPGVKGGAGVGFLCQKARGSAYEVKIVREAYTTPAGAWAIRFKVSFILLFRDTNLDERNVDRANDGQTDYDLYLQFLSVRTGLRLETKFRVFTDLRASLIHSTEVITPQGIEATLTLNNGGYPDQIPVDLALLNASFWDVGIVWDQFYWR